MAALDQTTGQAETSSFNMIEAFKKVGAAVATYFALDKIISFGKSCIDAASDVEEMQNKFDVVFQGMTDSVSTWADTYAESIGRNSNVIKGYLADNQNMFVGMGMTRDSAASLSENLVTLALDLASFNNLNEDDAVNAMSKALMGETESAKSLGAVLNENTIAMAQEALGYEGKFADLSEAEKMEVRYQAILMQSTDAVGDCVRSLDSYKGRTIQLNSAKQKLKETIGSMLLPVMTQLVGALTEVVSWMQQAVEWAHEHSTVLEVLAAVVGVITAAVIAYNTVQAIKTAMNAAETTSLGALIAAKLASAAATLAALAPYLLITAAIAAVIAIIVLCVKHWDEIKAKVIEVAQIIQEKWESIKSSVTEKVTSMVATVTSKFSDIKTTIQSKLNDAKAQAVNIFESIKSAISNKINAARDAVKDAIEKIKSFFKFEWSLPHLKLPHISITGSWGFNPPTVPSFGIEWYKKGAVLTSPTIFGLNGMKPMVGGEAGAEAVAPIDVLQGYVAEAVAGQNAGIVNALDKILDAIVALDDNMGGNLRDALDGTSLSINNREFGRLVRSAI